MARVEPEQGAGDEAAGEHGRRFRYRPRSGRSKGIDADACPSEEASMVMDDVA